MGGADGIGIEGFGNTGAVEVAATGTAGGAIGLALKVVPPVFRNIEVSLAGCGSGSPRGPKIFATSGGASSCLCGARRCKCAGLRREIISGRGNSTKVWSWVATSKKVPVGAAWRSSPNVIFTAPCGSCFITFCIEIGIFPSSPGDFTSAANAAGNRFKITFSGRFKASSGAMETAVAG